MHLRRYDSPLRGPLWDDGLAAMLSESGGSEKGLSGEQGNGGAEANL